MTAKIGHDDAWMEGVNRNVVDAIAAKTMGQSSSVHDLKFVIVMYY